MKKLNVGLLNKNVEEIYRYDEENLKGFGAAYLVMQEDETVLSRCFGTVDPEGSASVRPDTVFRLASMTKPVTAVAILILIDRGLLSPDDTLESFFPEFKNIPVIPYEGTPVPSKTPITVRQLLSHSSGIGSDGRKYAAMTAEDKKSIAASLKFYLRDGLDFEPGSTQSYSAVGAFDALGAIVEKVSGTDFDTFVREEILIPCRMKRTAFAPSEEEWRDLIAMHDRKDGKNGRGKTWDGCVFLDYPVTHPLGGAGLVSTLEDYGNFARMLLQEGRFEDRRLISPETFRLMHTTAFHREDRCYSWGLGVRIIDKKDPNLEIGTFGWSGAWGSHFWIDPVNKVAAVFMKNSHVDGGAGNESAQKFEKAVHDAFEA